MLAKAHTIGLVSDQNLTAKFAKLTILLPRSMDLSRNSRARSRIWRSACCPRRTRLLGRVVAGWWQRGLGRDSEASKSFWRRRIQTGRS
jgi:hypothetical protein